MLRIRQEAYSILKALSGGDIVQFLTDVVPLDDLRLLPHGVALTAVADSYNEMLPVARRPIMIGLKESKACNLFELHRCEFKLQQDHWQRCDKDLFKDDKTGRPVQCAALKPAIDSLLQKR